MTRMQRGCFHRVIHLRGDLTIHAAVNEAAEVSCNRKNKPVLFLDRAFSVESTGHHTQLEHYPFLFSYLFIFLPLLINFCWMMKKYTSTNRAIIYGEKIRPRAKFLRCAELDKCLVFVSEWSGNGEQTEGKQHERLHWWQESGSLFGSGMNLKAKGLPIPVQFPVMSMLADRKEKEFEGNISVWCAEKRETACEMKEGKCVNKPGKGPLLAAAAASFLPIRLS